MNAIKINTQRTIQAFSIALLVACQAPATPAETTSTQTEMETNIQVENNRKYAYMDTIQNYQRFKLEADKIIANNEVEIAKMRTQMQELRDEKKTMMIDRLKEQNEQMKTKLSEFKDDGKKSWSDFKKEVSHDIDAIEAAFKDASNNNVK